METENDYYYKKLFKCDLGNLEKIHHFLQNISDNIDALKKCEYNEQYSFAVDLKPGNDIQIASRQSFYSIKGEVLKDYFDDWNKIHTSVENFVGKTVMDFPVISFSKMHIQRHTDIRRAAAVNLGLWNTNSSTTCFWNKDDLAAHFRIQTGEAYLLNVKEQHSVIFNDIDLHFEPRAILMWSSHVPYFELLEKLKEKK